LRLLQKSGKPEIPPEERLPECGRFLKVGRKFGEDFDAVWLQKRLDQRE